MTQQYTVYLPGGGSTVVNANSPSAALGNVGVSGASLSPPSSSGGGGGSSGGGGGGSSGGGGGGSSSGQPTYQTINGQQTVASMAAQLVAVGWGGDPSNASQVIGAYQSTTGGAVTPSSGGGGGSSSSGGAGGGTGPLTIDDVQAAIRAGIGPYAAETSGFSREELAERKRQFDANLKLIEDQWLREGKPRLQIDQDLQKLREWQAQQDIALQRDRLALDTRTQGGQLGLDYLKTAASLGGPADYFQFNDFMRGVRNRSDVPGFLADLQNSVAPAAFGGTAGPLPTPQSAAGLLGQMGGTPPSVPAPAAPGAPPAPAPPAAGGPAPLPTPPGVPPGGNLGFVPMPTFPGGNGPLTGGETRPPVAGGVTDTTDPIYHLPTPPGSPPLAPRTPISGPIMSLPPVPPGSPVQQPRGGEMGLPGPIKPGGFATAPVGPEFNPIINPLTGQPYSVAGGETATPGAPPKPGGFTGVAPSEINPIVNPLTGMPYTPSGTPADTGQPAPGGPAPYMPNLPGGAAAGGSNLTVGGYNPDAALAKMASIFLRGPTGLRPGTLERYDQNELDLLGSAGRKLGVDPDAWLRSYRRAGIGQAAAAPI